MRSLYRRAAHKFRVESKNVTKKLLAKGVRSAAARLKLSEPTHKRKQLGLLSLEPEQSDFSDAGDLPMPLLPWPEEVSIKLQDQTDDPDPGDIPILPIHPSERTIDQASSARLAFDDAIALDFVASQRFRAQVTSSLCARDVNYYTHSYLAGQ